MVPVVPKVENSKSDKSHTSIYPPTLNTLKLLPKVSVLNTEIGDDDITPDIGFLYWKFILHIYS